MQPNYWSNPIAAQQAQDAAYNQASGSTPNATNSPNFFERMLPTAGAIGGGILGTLVSPFAGSVAGASLGDTAGRALENLLTHQNIKNDLGSSAVQGALGQAGGNVLGAAFRGGGSILSNLGGKYAGKEAAAQTEEALSNAFPDQALPAVARKNLNFGASLDLADQAGIPKTPEAFITAKNTATGANGLLNGYLDSIVAGAKPVDLTNFGDVVTSTLAKHPELGSLEATTAGHGGLPKPAASIASSTLGLFEHLLQNIGYKGGGSLTSQTSGENALDLLRTIGNLGSRYAGSEPGTPGAALKSVFDNVYANLRNQIYNRPEIDAAVSKLSLTPEDEAAILKATGGNQQLTDYLTNAINSAQRGRDLTSLESKFVDMGNAGQKTLDYTQNALGTGKTAQAARAEAQAPASRAKGLVQAAGTLGAVTGHPAGLLAVAAPKALEVAGPKLLSGGGGILGALGPKSVGDLTLQPTAALTQLATNLPNEAAPPTSMPTSLQSAAPVSNNGGVMNEPNIFTALANPQAVGNQNLAPLGMQALISMFDPYLLNSSITGPAQTAEQSIQKANIASALLPTLSAEFGQAGGGQGLIGGILSRLSGIIPGSPAANYGSQAAGVSQALTGAGIPTSPSTLPQLTQSTQTATDTIQRLQSLLQALGASPAR